MTRPEVMATESEEPLTAEDAALTYKDTLIGIPVETVYVFHPWQHYLTQGLYIVREDSTYPGDYVTAYRKFQSMLHKKYGKPMFETTPEQMKGQKPSSRQRIPHLRADSLAFVSRWRTKDTIITLELRHAPEGPPLTISYVSTSYLFTRKSP